MSVSAWAIKHPIVPISVFMILIFGGLIGFFSIPVTEYPIVNAPVIQVSIDQEGASPIDLITQVGKPIEDAIYNLEGVNQVSTTATNGNINVVVTFFFGALTQQAAMSDVKMAVGNIRQNLPKSIQAPTYKKINPEGGGPSLIYTVSNPSKTVDELSYFVDDVIARDVGSAQAVGRVKRLGGTSSAIEVNLDPDVLFAFNMSVSQINEQLVQNNINLGSGRGQIDALEYTIRAMGGAKSVEQLKALPIVLPSGQAIRLDDIADVSMGYLERNSFALVNNSPVVAFGVYRANGASIINTSKNAKQQIALIEKKYPNTSFKKITDVSIYSHAQYGSAMETLYEGMALAVFVVLCFLRQWRSTAIAAISLPLSIIPTFMVMYFLDYTLNAISLMGITLVIGILIDDAIVLIENVDRHIQMGKTPFRAAMDASSEISLTVMAISLTIVAVFLPVAFMGGLIGQYFKQFGVSVAIAVLFSLLCVQVLTPMLAAYFMKSTGKKAAPKKRPIMQAYLKLLNWTLNNRTITLALGVLIFATSIYSATLLPTRLFPPSDLGYSRIDLKIPPGTTLEVARMRTKELTQAILKIPEISTVFVDGSNSQNASYIYVDYGLKKTRKRTSTQILENIRSVAALVPDIKLNILNADQTSAITVNILGDTQQDTAMAAKQLVSEMGALPAIVGAQVGAALAAPQLSITPKFDIAAQLGVTVQALSDAIRLATIGGELQNLAKYDEGTHQIPILVRMNASARNNLASISQMRILSTTGALVPLGLVADIKILTSPNTITRNNRKYSTSIAADLSPGAISGPALAQIYKLPIAQNMPKGTLISRSGETKQMAKLFNSFTVAMVAGLLMVYVVLVMLFSNFIIPFTVLLSIPLAIGGAIFALFITDNSIGMLVIIGFLMLMGIVTKNAIILVAFAVSAMKNGLDSHGAMMDASQKRARPILMTTTAMAASMIPSALGLGSGGEARSPMAIAVIGGILLSTPLSLLFVPSMFSVFNGLLKWLAHISHNIIGINKPE